MWSGGHWVDDNGYIGRRYSRTIAVNHCASGKSHEKASSARGMHTEHTHAAESVGFRWALGSRVQCEFIDLLAANAPVAVQEPLFRDTCCILVTVARASLVGARDTVET